MHPLPTPFESEQTPAEKFKAGMAILASKKTLEVLENRKKEKETHRLVQESAREGCGEAQLYMAEKEKDSAVFWYYQALFNEELTDQKKQEIVDYFNACADQKDEHLIRRLWIKLIVCEFYYHKKFHIFKSEKWKDFEANLARWNLNISATGRKSTHRDGLRIFF